MDHGGGLLLNYNTGLLGRGGVMEVVLVADPQTLDASIASFKELVPGYEFGAGEKYAEFREGDHVAEYGLAALITGAAAAVAAQHGRLAAIGIFLAQPSQLLLIGLPPVGASFRKSLHRGAPTSAVSRKRLPVPVAPAARPPPHTTPPPPPPPPP